MYGNLTQACIYTYTMYKYCMQHTSYMTHHLLVLHIITNSVCATRPTVYSSGVYTLINILWKTYIDVIWRIIIDWIAHDIKQDKAVAYATGIIFR